MAFPLKVEAFPTGSAPGYLLRAFEINGEPWSRERLKGRDIVLSGVMMDAGARVAAEMTGTDPGRFNRTTAEVRSKKLVVVGGEELLRDD